MKQILQNLKSGETHLVDVPVPSPGSQELLIRSECSLVSVGTERMLVDFGKAGWIAKARQQPDKVRMVFNKVKTDGLMPTVEAVRNKLEQPIPLGYCNVGVIEQVGSQVSGFEVGQRVASNGNHAEYVSVPTNLCAKIPENISSEEASYTVLGAIALQGIRLSMPTLGESYVVMGLGLLGLLTVQILNANGCRVLGFDFDQSKVQLAREFGAEAYCLTDGVDPVIAAEQFSQGNGVDAVLITASTKSNAPVHQAATMCRKRGRIVLVGVVGLELSRADFYEKELSFQVSCSYGPGRYEANYEKKGYDYPIGFVRWTEQRNFEAVLQLMAAGKLNVKPLISHRFTIDQAEDAYNMISNGSDVLGLLLTYSGNAIEDATRPQTKTVDYPVQFKTDSPAVSFLGAGNYATGVLMPAFQKAGAFLHQVGSKGGVSGTIAARRFGFQSSTTDTPGLLNNSATKAVVVATQHNSHAHWVQQALRAGKHVFVEKPLAMTLPEVEEIENALKELPTEACPLLTVGFNRRFSPLAVKAKELLRGRSEPISMIFTINAGAIPSDHWTQDPQVGGGRILGEACHFIDLARFWADSPIQNFHVKALQRNGSSVEDITSLQVGFADGSIATIHYFSNGDKSLPKERFEVFSSGRVLQLNNFKNLQGYGWQGFTRQKLWRQDKGQKGCVQAFLDAIQGQASIPIPLPELLEVSRYSILMAEALRAQ